MTKVLTKEELIFKKLLDTSSQRNPLTLSELTGTAVVLNGEIFYLTPNMAENIRNISHIADVAGN